MRAIAIIVFLGVACAMAQNTTDINSKAKAAYDKADVARKTGDVKAAVAGYRKAIELDPSFIDAHESYIFTSQDLATTDVSGAVFGGTATAEQNARFKKERADATDRLEAEYQSWAKDHPGVAGYQWGLGDLNIYKDPKAAIRYFEAAVKINPKFAPAYQSISLMDEVQGDLDGMKENLRKAVEAAPDNPKYLFDYAYAFHDSDVSEFNRLCLELVRRFPESKEAAQAYYWMAEAAPTDSEKLHYLQALKDDKAPAAADWKGGGMQMLFDIYLKTDHANALALAQEQMGVKDKDDKGTWTSLHAYAQAMVDADQLMKDGKGDIASAKLDAVKLPKWYHTQQLVLERARVLDARGQNQKAYDVLLEAYAATPSDESHAVLVQSGQKVGKDTQQVDADVWALQSKNAKPAADFSLGSYTSDKKISLADFRGHVILLNFWYPLCGPCRGEFPYIQAVLDKYKDKGFQIVAVNVQPEEDDFVLPLLKGFRLGFIPLRGTEEFATDSYHVRGEPTNFLIGADGKMYFGPLRPIQGPDAQRTLELQVIALLQEQSSATKQ